MPYPLSAHEYWMLVGGSRQGLLHCSSPPPNLPAWCRLSVSVVHTCHVCISGARVPCLCQWSTRAMSVSVVHTCHVCVSGALVPCLCQWCTRVMSMSVVHTCHVCVSCVKSAVQMFRRIRVSTYVHTQHLQCSIHTYVQNCTYTCIYTYVHYHIYCQSLFKLLIFIVLLFPLSPLFSFFLFYLTLSLSLLSISSLYLSPFISYPLSSPPSLSLPPLLSSFSLPSSFSPSLLLLP